MPQPGREDSRSVGLRFLAQIRAIARGTARRPIRAPHPALFQHLGVDFIRKVQIGKNGAAITRRPRRTHRAVERRLPLGLRVLLERALC